MKQNRMHKTKIPPRTHRRTGKSNLYWKDHDHSKCNKINTNMTAANNLIKVSMELKTREA